MSFIMSFYAIGFGHFANGVYIFNGMHSYIYITAGRQELLWDSTIMEYITNDMYMALRMAKVSKRTSFLIPHLQTLTFD